MKLDTRKEMLLSAIVREHSQTAEPVASDVLKKQMDVSSATIRNEMAVLEKEGYLRQPHTSAGRVPTEKGYRYYIANCLEQQNVDKDVFDLQAALRGTDELETRMKMLARELAGEVRQGVFVGFAPESTFYTGLSYLFEQPEFESVDLVRSLSEIIDNLDQVVKELFDEIAPGVQVYIGSENPFGSDCGIVLLKSKHNPILGVLGPIRMDYDRTIAVMKGIEGLIG